MRQDFLSSYKANQAFFSETERQDYRQKMGAVYYLVDTLLQRGYSTSIVKRLALSHRHLHMVPVGIRPAGALMKCS